MTTTPNPVLDLIGRTFRDTRGTARTLMAMQFNRDALWTALLLVSVVSVIVMKLSLLLFPAVSAAPFSPLSPFGMAGVVSAALTVMVFALHFAGQSLGGTGRFPMALLLVIWWQVIAIVLQAAQTAAMLLSPLLAGVVTLACLGFSIFCLVVFVDELHGFNSTAKAVATVLVAFVGLLIGMSVILTLIGVAAQGGAV